MRKAEFLRSTGFVIYVASFFLPAIGNPDLHLERSLPGWSCAWLSLWFGLAAMFDRSGMTPEGHRTFLSLLWSGLTNPLLLLYLGMTLKRRYVSFRQVLAALVLLLAISASIVISRLALVPLVGYYMWVAGVAAVLGPDMLPVISKLKTRAVRNPA